MAPPLPCELEEEILSRLPPQSLIRFRTVCKQWNSLFNNKRFINNHMSRSRPQFLLVSDSKIYSIDIINHDINSTIELHELPSSIIPYKDKSFRYPSITACDELLVYDHDLYGNKTALWNPWMSQVKYFEPKDRNFRVIGLGYDNSRPEKVYKFLAYFNSHPIVTKVVVYDCASNALKFIDTPVENFDLSSYIRQYNVSLNGNLYWVTRNDQTDEYFVESFDFSTENFKRFCLLPFQQKKDFDELILGVYKGDRFSLLMQCYVIRKIEIWVTKKKIEREEEKVVWINLMTLPTTNLPTTLSCWQLARISYFIDEKTLFICCGQGKNNVAYIYIVKEDLCKEIQLDSGIVYYFLFCLLLFVYYCCHCVYTPNLISVPLS